MRKAIQYVTGMSVKDAVSLGFDSFEVRYEDIEAFGEKTDGLSNDGKEAAAMITGGGKIIGVVVNGLKMVVGRTQVGNAAVEKCGGGEAQVENAVEAGAAEEALENMKNCIDKAAACGAGYVVAETKEMENLCGLAELLTEIAEYAANSGIKIYIENGYVCRDGVHYHTESSNAGTLCRLVETLNRKANENADSKDSASQFGICINVGYANLLGINVRQFITECGKHLAVMHMSDNNGISDQQQMPYTFTTGRGINSTDWYHIIGALYKLNFQGEIVFDTVGTFRRTPVKLHRAMLELLGGIYGEWQECFNIEKRLSQPGKNIILFGAGKMAQNYMEAFGEKFPPLFLVDNNEKLWGTKRLGFEVKNPQAIFEIPEEQRSVWICNMYYDAIGLQLDKMGVRYSCYFDNYYL